MKHKLVIIIRNKIMLYIEYVVKKSAFLDQNRGCLAPENRHFFTVFLAKNGGNSSLDPKIFRPENGNSPSREMMLDRTVVHGVLWRPNRQLWPSLRAD